MYKNLKNPCQECPFRKNSLPGWLGADDPQNFMNTVMADVEMPCHLTIDYDSEFWEEDLQEAEQCAGAAIFFSNISKLSRDRNRLILSKNANVFASVKEFFVHHECKKGLK